MADQAIETATDGRGSRATPGAMVRETHLEAGQSVMATAEERRVAPTTVGARPAGSAGVLVVETVVGPARSGLAASAGARIVEEQAGRAGKTPRAALLVSERVPLGGPVPPRVVPPPGVAVHPRVPVTSAAPVDRGALAVSGTVLVRVEPRNGYPDDRRPAGRTRGGPTRPDVAGTCRMR